MDRKVGGAHPLRTKQQHHDPDIVDGRLSVFIHKREEQSSHEVIQPLLRYFVIMATVVMVLNSDDGGQGSRNLGCDDGWAFLLPVWCALLYVTDFR